jgi:hypothetical protein
LDINNPGPIPFHVLDDVEIVGFGLMDQTTPLIVTESPPSDTILPPERTVELEIESTIIVDKVGKVELLLEIASFKHRTERPNFLRLPEPKSRPLILLLILTPVFPTPIDK